MTEEEKQACKIEEYCSLHTRRKCICLDRPLIDEWCKYCKYYNQTIKKSEDENK